MWGYNLWAGEFRSEAQAKPRYDLLSAANLFRRCPQSISRRSHPANEAKLTEIAYSDADDIGIVYAAAKKAFGSAWSKLPGPERVKYFYRFAHLLQDRAREFAVAETLGSGKPIKVVRSFDVSIATVHFFFITLAGVINSIT